MSYRAVIESPIGRLGIQVEQGRLMGIDFHVEQACVDPKDGVTQEVVHQLQAYFEDSAWQFKLPLAEQGTPFQRRVWRALGGIPRGAPLTYGELAQDLNSAPRAIGQACRTNPVPIVVPCHRIVAKSGLGGFAGKRVGMTLDIKRWLLRHEGYDVDGG